MMTLLRRFHAIDFTGAERRQSVSSVQFSSVQFSELNSQSAASHFTVPPRAHSSGKHYPAMRKDLSP